MMKWYKVFRSKEEAVQAIPENSKRVIRLGDLKICMVNKREVFYAIENDCPHLGDSLSKGTLNAENEVICPWHTYRFNLETGKEAMNRCRDAKIFQVKQEQEGIFVGVPEL
ncbi:Rieske (2Fe-2S) protein [Peijinzhouia sedimentorum]